MKNILIFLFVFSFNTIISQTSNFEGTWKWENGNQTFYVYVDSEIFSSGKKILSIDYKMVQTINNVTTEIYSSKINGEYFWAGAFLSDYGINAKGDIKDCTHPQTTDCYDGQISFDYIPASGGLNSQPKIHWQLSEKRGLIGYNTNNPPTDFNVPKNIILTKVP
jgi:hypothetical protein